MVVVADSSMPEGWWIVVRLEVQFIPRILRRSSQVSWGRSLVVLGYLQRPAGGGTSWYL